ncbi:MAG: acetamidase/formamidase family protein [Croceibacterium sp.]
MHFAWDNSLTPLLTVAPGDTVVLDTRDSADGYYHRDSTAEDVARKGPLVGHPLTGPIHVRDARPGDILAVEILDMRPRSDFGWTAIRPGRGLLPPEDFGDHFIQIWDLSDGSFARMRQRPEIAVPIAAFPGIIGTALAEPGTFTTMPPRHNGGNIDCRHLVAGSTIYLPVLREGGLLSLGDAHAAQGDGEVCVTAVEMDGQVTVRINLIQGRSIEEPHLRLVSAPGASTNVSPSFHATMASAPDLHECARQAVRYMIAHVVRERGLSREEAYVLCSVCVDLKITQIVDAPNWSVTAVLPEMVFG